MKITKKEFEKNLVKKFENVTKMNFTEYVLGEEIKSVLYYENGKHFATWSSGNGYIINGHAKYKYVTGK